jgi:CRISPR-associated endonuclease/helicase Cas3
VQLAPSSDDADRVATIALDAARRGARVLVIRNTVRDCLATQQALERMTVAQDEDALLFRCSGVAAPHHARFAREDRTALDRALEDRFGRDAWARGCVAVATQTVQQSLDIDADYLLTDLCPVDVLLQRLGRLHRHVRPARSAGYQEPAAIVLVPDARDLSRYIRKGGEAAGPHGLGRVYENLTVIEATWRLLERFPVLVIPEMSRLLVEHAVHPEALRAIEEELGDAWIAHGRTTRAIYLAHGRLAHLNMVDWSTGFGELVFPEGELSRVIQTRLGQDDRLACFAVAQPGPFGHPVAELILPAHLVVGAPADAAPTDVQAVPSGFAFTFGARRYTYDRLGLRRHDITQSDPEVPDA